MKKFAILIPTIFALLLSSIFPHRKRYFLPEKYHNNILIKPLIARNKALVNDD